VNRLLSVCLVAAITLLPACSTGASAPSSPTPPPSGAVSSPASAASTPSGTASTPSSAASTTASAAAVTGGVFRLTKPDGSIRAFSLDDLKKLPLASILSDGQPQEGPTLSSVLDAAGVTSFGSVVVTGPSGSKTLARAEVTKDVILDFNNRGSVKLVSPTMPKADRIVDITKIEVKP
jgi:hypothetical protein